MDMVMIRPKNIRFVTIHSFLSFLSHILAFQFPSFFLFHSNSLHCYFCCKPVEITRVQRWGEDESRTICDIYLASTNFLLGLKGQMYKVLGGGRQGVIIDRNPSFPYLSSFAFCPIFPTAQRESRK